FDEILCGYKDRDAILKSDHQKLVILRNGILKPVIISKGKMIGSWKRTLKKERVVIETEPFQNVDKKEQAFIKSAAKQYGDFLGLDTEFMAT
ncbi:MAG: DNA glycosylase AlkZ-like family protein, partial [Balneolaceae bacterium]